MAKIRCQLDWALYGVSGKEITSKLIPVVGRTHFPTIVGLECPFSYQLSDMDHSYSSQRPLSHPLNGSSISKTSNSALNPSVLDLSELPFRQWTEKTLLSKGLCDQIKFTWIISLLVNPKSTDQYFKLHLQNPICHVI